MSSAELLIIYSFFCLDIVKLLIRCKANLEEADKDGDGPIHHAAFGDEPAVIQVRLFTKKIIRMLLSSIGFK